MVGVGELITARTLLAGTFRPGAVATRFVVSTLLPSAPATASIEAAWRRVGEDGTVHLFDGPMCRLEMFHVQHLPGGESRLTLDLSPTSYKTFLGTNLHGPRDLPRESLANPLGVSPALETIDGFLLFGRRSDRVAYYPRRLHPFSGALEPAVHGAPPDVFAECRRELAEELSLTADEVPQVALLGIVEDADIRHPELILHARTMLTRDAVMARLDREEHDAAHAVSATRDGVSIALGDPSFTPVARAALELWRAYRDPSHR